jgi:hypothetical protein
MWWQSGGSWHSAESNMMPSQPYMKPAVDKAVRSGHAERVYEDHWRKAFGG